MKKAIIFLMTILTCFISSYALADSAGKLTTEEKYEQAQIFLAENNFEAAAEMFADIQGYKDSSQYVVYSRALSYAEKGEYSIAIKGFTNLGSFRDSAQQLIYYEGRSYEDQDDFSGLTKAQSIYEEIILFRDCLTRIDAIDRRIEEIYLNAIQLGNSGNYKEASFLLHGMQSYKDASLYSSYYEARWHEEHDMPASDLFALEDYKKLDGFLDSKERFDAVADNFINKVKVGDTFSFGAKSWQVLDVDDKSKRLLIIAKYTVDPELTYGYMNTYTTWKNSQIRAWLNNTFFYDQFSEKEAALIEEVTLEETAIKPGSADNSYSISYTGETTTDKIFVLSVNEAYRYFESDSDRALQNMYDDWWLRDGGNNGSIGYVAAYVNAYGSIGTTFHNGAGGRALRPALYLNLNWDGKSPSDSSPNQSIPTQEAVSIPDVMNKINSDYGEKIWELDRTFSSTWDNGKYAEQTGISYIFDHVKNKNGTYVGVIDLWQASSTGLVTIQSNFENDAKNYQEIAYTCSSLLDELYGIPRDKTQSQIYKACTELKPWGEASWSYEIENGQHVSVYLDLGLIWMDVD